MADKAWVIATVSDVALPDSYRPLAEQPITANLDVPKRALAIGAHPDDVEYGCGGTLAKWAAHGCEIFHVICTDGSKGTWDPDVDQRELIETRKHEQRLAARALGSTSDDHVVFLGWTDGELDSGLTQRSKVAYWIRRFQPDVVLGHDPWRPYRIHPDHRHAGLLACEGVVAARDPKFFPEQNVAPHRPSLLLLWEAAVVHHIESIDGFVSAKSDALLAHESQFETTMRIGDATNHDERRLFADRIDHAARQAAQEAGNPADVNVGEVFAAIRRL
jgi:LmbE family N-acetylglucosaminyl deacetylase